MMIGLIVEHKKAKRHHGSCKTTLIVCPLSLMDQWAAEIKSKTEDGLTVCLYHGPNRTKGISFYFLFAFRLS